MQYHAVNAECGNCCYNHWNRVGGKFYTQRGIKIVDGLDQTDTTDLEQIVHIFIMIIKPFDHG